MTDSKPKHLLVIRLSAMGDVAMVVPVLKALRESYPQLRITVLTRAFFHPFFREIPGIEFITPDFTGRHKGFGGIMRLFRDVRACGVTHVADLHDVLRTMILRTLLLLTGLKVSRIDKGRAEKRALTRKFRKIRKPLKTSVERYRETILRLGFRFGEPPVPLRAVLPVPEVIRGEAGDKGGVWIGIAPFAQHTGKIYPTQQMVRLIELLSPQVQRVFIFGGGPYEQDFAQCMQERFENVVSVIGKIKLAQELDLITNMDLMVTMDSSAMHMASLYGVPVVSIWGATHPDAGFYGFGQDIANAVQLDMTCRPCSVYGNKPCMYGDYRCMGQIPPLMVSGRVADLVRRQHGDAGQ